MKTTISHWLHWLGVAIGHAWGTARDRSLEPPPAEPEAVLLVMHGRLRALTRMQQYASFVRERDTTARNRKNAEDAERKCIELGMSLTKVIKNLEKKGDTRATPKRAGKQLQQEVKITEEEQVPLMKLVCTNGIKDRHWAQIKKITHLDFDVTASTAQ